MLKTSGSVGVSGEQLVTVTAFCSYFGVSGCFCVLLEESVSRSDEPEFL